MPECTCACSHIMTEEGSDTNEDQHAYEHDDAMVMRELDLQPDMPITAGCSISNIPAAHACHHEPLRTVAQQRGMISEVKARLQLMGTAHGRDHAPDAQWHQELQQILLPVEEFRAGSTRQHMSAWESWLGDGQQAQETLRTVREGVCFEWTEPLAACQTVRPGFRKKYDQVYQMLTRRFGPERADTMVSGDRPHAARFPNKRSVQDHEAFMRKEVASLVASGAWTTWQNAGESQAQERRRVAGAFRRLGWRRLLIACVHRDAATTDGGELHWGS